MSVQKCLLGLCCLASSLVLVGCRNDGKAGEAQPGTSGSGTSASAPSAAPPAAASAQVTEPAAASPEVADAGAGAWVDSAYYKFRFDGVVRCEAPDEAQTKGNAPGSGAAEKGKRIGILVHVSAKVDNFFASARDIELENDGAILNTLLVAASKPEKKGAPGCSPALQPRTLLSGESVSGVVFFEVPPQFNSEGRPLKLRYKPTRWGGAAAVNIEIPACLDQCEKALPPKRKR